MRYLLASLLLIFSSGLFGQESGLVETGSLAAAPSSVVPPGATVRPGMLWGTVISKDEFQPLTGKQRWELHWRQTYWTPGALFGSAGSALGDHLGDNPSEWGQGSEGYAKRFANRFARNTIRASLTAAGSAALGYDTRYVKCGCTGFLPRVGHAILWNFLTLDREGRTVVNTPLIGSAVATGFIANSWMPAGYSTAGTTVRDAGIQLGFGAVFNLIREFVPRKKRR